MACLVFDTRFYLLFDYCITSTSYLCCKEDFGRVIQELGEITLKTSTKYPLLSDIEQTGINCQFPSLQYSDTHPVDC